MLVHDRAGADLKDLLADVYADLLGTIYTATSLHCPRGSLTLPLTEGAADDKEKKQRALAEKKNRCPRLKQHASTNTHQLWVGRTNSLRKGSPAWPWTTSTTGE